MSCFQPFLRCYRNDHKTSTVIVRKHFGPLQIVPWGFSQSIIRKKTGDNVFFACKKAFFKILCFQQVLRSWKNAPIGSTVSVRMACGPLYYLSWALGQSIIRRKVGPILLSSWKSYFLKCLFLSTSEVLKNWSYYSQSNCQKTLWTPIECSLMPIILDNGRKIDQFVFSSEKFAFFFKKLCFQQFRKCYRYDPITSTVFVKIPFGP